MVKSLKTITIFTLAVTALIITGCAKVRVNKVPTPTQYVEWTDKMQRKADKMEGFRFYLPRPFINVFQSFPVRTDIYIAHGTVSPDSKYITISRLDSESEFNKNYVVVKKGDIDIPVHSVRLPNEEEAKLQAAERKDTDKLINALPKGEMPKIPIGGESSGSSSGTLKTPTPITGIETRKTTNDNTAYAYQPLRGNFDIVYVPDFEEQYVISGRAGLGNADFAVNFGQGWSLQGFNSTTDNREFNKRMFDLIDTSAKLAKTAASAQLGGIPSIAAASGETLLPMLQAGEVEGGTVLPHQEVSLKIVVIHYAAKGMYPVIKERELQMRTINNDLPFSLSRLFLNLFSPSPKFRNISEYDQKVAIEKAQIAVKDQSGNVTVPVYPFQYISFNTFRYMAIEMISDETTKLDPYRHLYHSTGTTNDTSGRNDEGFINIIKILKDLSNESNSSEDTNVENGIRATLSKEDINAFHRAVVNGGVVRVPDEGEIFFTIAQSEFEPVEKKLKVHVKRHPDGSLENPPGIDTKEILEEEFTTSINIAKLIDVEVDKVEIENARAFGLE